MRGWWSDKLYLNRINIMSYEQLEERVSSDSYSYIRPSKNVCITL